ncbi:MAG: hypothetical protein H0W39_07625 [Sphingomonas sp.]|nr:hypothetical protein [Sphingomonas sp.]
MNRPFLIRLDPMKREAAMISECDGVFVIEPMKFVSLAEARSWARRARGLSA